MKIQAIAGSLRIAVGLLAALMIAACAGNLTEEDKQAREFERLERKAEIQTFIAFCEQAGRTVIYTGPTYQKLRDPVKQVPNHARLSEYRCAGSTTVNRQLGAGGS